MCIELWSPEGRKSALEFERFASFYSCCTPDPSVFLIETVVPIVPGDDGCIASSTYMLSSVSASPAAEAAAPLARMLAERPGVAESADFRALCAGVQRMTAS